MTKNNRNGKIDFFRFLYSAIIVVHHSRKFLGDANCKFLGGSFAVEFFFLVSGYLMMSSISRVSCDKNTDMLGHETLSFLWRKVKSVYPAVFVAWIFALSVTSVAKNKSVLGIMALVVDSFFEMTLLKMSGIYSISMNGVVWYISSMVLVMAILYPLIRKYPDIMVHIGLPMIVLFSMGYLAGNFGGTRDPLGWTGFAYKGTIRAMGEIALGTICYRVVKVLDRYDFTRLGKLLITALEWGTHLIVILYMYYEKSSGRDFFFLLVMAIAVALSFSHKGIDARFFDKPFFNWLGQYSFYLFLGHTFYGDRLNLLLPIASNNQKKVVYYACAIVTSFVIWGISIAMKKAWPSGARIFKRVLLHSSKD